LPIYLIECKHCEISWDVEASADNPPKKKKCKKCGKMGNRVYTSPYITFVGEDWETKEHERDRFRRDGMDKDTANEFLENSIKTSKERMETGGQHYKKMVTSEEELRKMGYKVQKTTPEKAQKKAQAATKLVKKIKEDRKLV